MRQISNIQRTTLLLVLLLAEWAWSFPLSALPVADALPLQQHSFVADNGNKQLPARADENAASYLLRLELPNKNALNNVYFSSNSEYGYLYGNDSVYIQEGEEVYIKYFLNTNYKCNAVYLNGEAVSKDASSSYFYFDMPAANVDLSFDMEYDPASPSDPQPEVIDTTTKFKLQMVSNPVSAGNFLGTGSYAAGTKVNVYAYSNTGYVFKCWTQNGDTLSTKYSFTYTMPASDAVLTAHYIYNPSSPTDPEQPTLKHPLSVIASPA